MTLDVKTISALLAAAPIEGKLDILDQARMEMAYTDNLPREICLALWKLASDPSPAVREALVELIQSVSCPLLRSDMEEFVPLLCHTDQAVRETIIQLFMLIPWYFDDVLCMKIADAAIREDFDIQEDIAAFLRCLGQGCLIQIEPDEEAGS